MVSNIIVNHLAGVTALGLTKNVDLFAENGRGDKCVVIKTTTTYGPAEGNMSCFRTSPVQVLVKEYKTAAGYALAEKVIAQIQSMAGTYVYGDETYDVLGVDVQAFPTVFLQGFTSNVLIFYTITIN